VGFSPEKSLSRITKDCLTRIFSSKMKIFTFRIFFPGAQTSKKNKTFYFPLPQPTLKKYLGRLEMAHILLNFFCVFLLNVSSWDKSLFQIHFFHHGKERQSKYVVFFSPQTLSPPIYPLKVLNQPLRLCLFVSLFR